MFRETEYITPSFKNLTVSLCIIQKIVKNAYVICEWPPCPDDVVEEVDTQNRVVRNYLKMPSLHRKDHDDVLSCVASNTNLTARPQITYININMVCKYLFYTT